MTANVLKSEGFDVVAAEDGEAANGVPEGVDAILVELRADNGFADKISGLRAASRFKNIPVLGVVESSAKDLVAVADTAGASDHFFLPLDPKNLSAKIGDLLRPVGKNGNVNVDIMKPFIASTIDIFSTMAQIKVEQKELFLKKDYKMFGDLSGVIGLSGEAVGSAVISFSEELARKFVAKMLQDEPDNLSMDDVRDGVGEFINMIAGGAKAALTATPYHFRISIPTVVQGHGHEISHRRDTPCIAVVFSANGDEFAVQLSLAPKKTS